MDTMLEGRWYCRSFRQAPPRVPQDGPQLLPWSPPGVLEAVTGECGQFMGTLLFGTDIRLQCFGRLLPGGAGTQRRQPECALRNQGLLRAG